MCVEETLLFPNLEGVVFVLLQTGPSALMVSETGQVEASGAEETLGCCLLHVCGVQAGLCSLRMRAGLQRASIWPFWGCCCGRWGCLGHIG